MTKEMAEDIPVYKAKGSVIPKREVIAPTVELANI